VVVKVWVSPVIQRHVGFETNVKILVGVTRHAVKNLDRIQMEVSIGFFIKDMYQP
jgi:hypothetical protein